MILTFKLAHALNKRKRARLSYRENVQNSVLFHAGVQVANRHFACLWACMREMDHKKK